MHETLRLSDAPEFQLILREFALRLYPELSLENLVLANVQTTLHYRNGQTFAYTLDPANFRVEEFDEPVCQISPINGLPRQRSVVYSIRSVEGIWHTPIGTTAILTDILGLERRHTSAMQTILLDAAHGARQRELLHRHGDDLRGYAGANNLKEALVTHEYFSSLCDDDPIREHLRALLHARIPLSRTGLRLLRAHSRQITPAQIELVRRKAVIASPAPPPPRPAQPPPKTVPRVDDGRRVIERDVLAYLQPHTALLLSALPEVMRAEATSVLAAGGECVSCTRELLAALREITGEPLTVLDIRGRQQHGHSFGEVTPFLLFQWPKITAYLNELTPLQHALWRAHLEQHQLTMYERSALREAWQAVRSATEPQAAASSFPVVILLGDPEQRWWHQRRDQIRLHLRPEQGALLERLNLLLLRVDDVSALEEALAAVGGAALPYVRIEALRLRPELVRAAPDHLQADLALAVRDNNFPPHLHAALAEAAERLNLELITLQPPTLPSHSRRALRLAWAHLAPQLDSGEALAQALDENRYTVKQAEQLRALVLEPLPETVLPTQDRLLFLRHPAEWGKRFSEEERRWLLESLQRKHYTPHLLGALDGLAGPLAAWENDQQARNAQELYERLLAYWAATCTRDARALRGITPAALASALPEICRAFEKNDRRLTLDIQQEVRKFVVA